MKSSSTSQPAPSQISETSSSCTSLPALHGAHAQPDVQDAAADPALHGAHARPDVEAPHDVVQVSHDAQVPTNSAISAPDLLRLRERRSSRRASISMSQVCPAFNILSKRLHS